MSLYYEAEKFLIPDASGSSFDEIQLTESLTSRIFGAKGLKNKPIHLYALIVDTIKWSTFLCRVIESSELLQKERQLTPAQALLLTHDVLLSNNGIATHKDHPLKTAVSRHRARLLAEFTRARIKAGYATKEEWSAAIDRSFREGTKSTRALLPPRWVRINSIRTSFEIEVSTTFSDYGRDCSLHDLISPSLSSMSKLSVDEHIPNLIAVPTGIDLTATSSYRKGNIILQDKASCFPAYLLDPQSITGDIIDACAAPGNKTTHLAALLHESSLASMNVNRRSQQIIACEKDEARSLTLEQMIKRAGAERSVDICAKQDFLRLNPVDARWQFVEALLLDPSCSGSGMLDREDDGWLSRLVLPQRDVHQNGGNQNTNDKRGKKRKRDGRNKQADSLLSEDRTMTDPQADAQAVETVHDSTSKSEALSKRLKGLSNFQVSIIKHAFRFPGARRIVYSTCSIHAEENENVVLDALTSEVALNRGWKVLKRADQVDGMKKWPRRGDSDAVKHAMGSAGFKYSHYMSAEDISEACIRCSKGTEEGTMGFFVVCFIRDVEKDHSPNGPDGQEGDEEEWDGFSDSDHG